MYVVIWQYTIRPHFVKSFLEYYGTDGKWADLFRKSDDYLSTELLRSDSDPLQFITIDRWKSKQTYTLFINKNKTTYTALDKITEAWTEREGLIGNYTM